MLRRSAHLPESFRAFASGGDPIAFADWWVMQSQDVQADERVRRMRSSMIRSLLTRLFERSRAWTDNEDAITGALRRMVVLPADLTVALEPFWSKTAKPLSTARFARWYAAQPTEIKRNRGVMLVRRRALREVADEVTRGFSIEAEGRLAGVLSRLEASERERPRGWEVQRELAQLRAGKLPTVPASPVALGPGREHTS